MSTITPRSAAALAADFQALAETYSSLVNDGFGDRDAEAADARLAELQDEARAAAQPAANTAELYGRIEMLLGQLTKDLSAAGATLDAVQVHGEIGGLSITTRQGTPIKVPDDDFDALHAAAAALPEDHPGVGALDRVIDQIRAWS